MKVDFTSLKNIAEITSSNYAFLALHWRHYKHPTFIAHLIQSHCSVIIEQLGTSTDIHSNFKLKEFAHTSYNELRATPRKPLPQRFHVTLATVDIHCHCCFASLRLSAVIPILAYAVQTYWCSHGFIVNLSYSAAGGGETLSKGMK